MQRYTHAMFATCFPCTCSLALQTVLRIWDRFLLEGSSIVLLLCFYIIKTFEPQAANIEEGSPDVISMFNTAARSLFDCDAVMKVSAIVFCFGKPFAFCSVLSAHVNAR